MILPLSSHLQFDGQAEIGGEAGHIIIGHPSSPVLPVKVPPTQALQAPVGPGFVGHIIIGHPLSSVLPVEVPPIQTLHVAVGGFAGQDTVSPLQVQPDGHKVEGPEFREFRQSSLLPNVCNP
jgi:hypothetical protein